MRGRGMAAALIVALVLLPTGSAVPASAHLRLAAPLALEGQAWVAGDEGLVGLPALQAVPVQAAHLNITLLRIEQPEENRAPGSLPELRLPVLGGPEAPREQYLDMEQPQMLSVLTAERGGEAWLAVGPFDAGSLGLRGQDLALRTASRALDLPGEMLAQGPQPWLHAEGAGVLQAQGTLRALFRGASLLVENGTASLQVDTAGGDWVALLRWTGAHLTVASPEPFTLLAPALRLDLAGELRAARAWGAMAHTGQEELRGEALVARGTWQGLLQPQGDEATFDAQGELTYLAVGPREQQFSQAAVAGGALALGAAVAAWQSQGLRLVFAPLYARVAPEELLDNEVRRRVHERVRTHPGSDVKDTAAACSVSWSTAAYHLHRLEREGVLLSRRSGRSKRFFLNGAQPPARAEAIGALRNPTSLAIARLVAERPGLMQKEIAAHLALPASTVSWHMRRLRELGVVREERRWRRAEYAAGPLWPELQAGSPSSPAGVA
ncbi:MAG: helix-turn-helix domain-containing protein [Halobacteriales archaeon]|nr:helix-turn-helix domain-containing protein [Halobacteriales archaeon]